MTRGRQGQWETVSGADDVESLPRFTPVEAPRSRNSGRSSQ